MTNYGEADGAHRSLREKRFLLTRQERILSEAILAGHDALRRAEDAKKPLCAARKWCEADIFAVGGMMRFLKRRAMNRARERIFHLESGLRRFEATLKAASVRADVRLDVGDWFRAQDYLIGDSFAKRSIARDMSRMEKDVGSLQERILRCVEDLEHRKAVVRRKSDAQGYKLKSCILNTKV